MTSPFIDIEHLIDRSDDDAWKKALPYCQNITVTNCPASGSDGGGEPPPSDTPAVNFSEPSHSNGDSDA